MRRLISLFLGCSSLAIASVAFGAGAPAAGTGMGASAAGAASPDQEISTALQHAGMSAGSSTLADVHMHLHHVLNCLVGPSGKGFDATAEDPCKGQGNGAVNDVDNKSKKLKKLDEAVKDTDKGLKDNNLKKAQKYAKDVMKDLQAAQKAK
ncbi:MAG TPA: hypothetical protein VGH91_00120 [Gammaproteobacteria bacterium]|jgi:hypothetical protein